MWINRKIVMIEKNRIRISRIRIGKENNNNMK